MQTIVRSQKHQKEGDQMTILGWIGVTLALAMFVAVIVICIPEKFNRK